MKYGGPIDPHKTAPAGCGECPGDCAVNVDPAAPEQLQKGLQLDRTKAPTTVWRERALGLA